MRNRLCGSYWLINTGSRVPPLAGMMMPASYRTTQGGVPLSAASSYRTDRWDTTVPRTGAAVWYTGIPSTTRNLWHPQAATAFALFFSAHRIRLASPIFFLVAALRVRFSHSPALTTRVAFNGNDSAIVPHATTDSAADTYPDAINAKVTGGHTGSRGLRQLPCMFRFRVSLVDRTHLADVLACDGGDRIKSGCLFWRWCFDWGGVGRVDPPRPRAGLLRHEHEAIQ